ncbi:NAD(P)H-dependent flavin oxidoreductase [Paenibacillus flagellatus]|uniref:Probable nitronate monooxygenase n=1 Tax=Paenibacillus flagellatus TaxID=2211139 RepID=A0A2V5JYW6_9BACL|nr:nitronate monooxygenase family protein [Paenibacillus flagellatus]PYI50484.1 nitronate monooxygenase [Paenibacillus flagellatus]
MARDPLQTPLCRLLGIELPIIQAGMAGGPTTPELVAAVSEAGGLGTLGAAYMEPEAIREAVRAVRRLTAKPFGVNVFVVPMRDDYSRYAEVQPHLDRLGAPLGVAPRAGSEPLPTPDRLERQFAVLLEEDVPVIGTAFGPLPEPLGRAARDAGRLVTTMVTAPEEARLAEAAGCDVLVAQGGDAGGHRGTFDVERHPYGALTGTFSLVPLIADQASVPVVAAGGVMDGRGLAAALMLGAQGAQLGTRFLTAAESGAHAAYQEALLAGRDDDTVVTRWFSGRPARGLRNRFVEEAERLGIEPLPFPSQNTATGPLRQAAAKRGDAGYMALWSGQARGMLTRGTPAADIVRDIAEQARALLTRG